MGRDRLNTCCPALSAEKLGDFVSYFENLILDSLTKKIYLDPVNGDDAADGSTPAKANKTLPVAYAKLETNKNQGIVFLAGATSLVLTASFDWAKSYTHFIAVAGNSRFGGRARLGHAGTAMSPLFTVSGNGNMFHNVHFQHGQASATNLICLSVTGLRNVFSGCHIESSLDSVASGGSYAWRAITIGAAAQGNQFFRCTVGSWTTVWASASGKLVYFEGDNADTYFEDCEFLTNTSSTSMKVIDFAGAISGGYSKITFDRCRFFNTNAAPAALMGVPTNGYLLIVDCRGSNFSAWSANSTQVIIMNGAANIATGGLGVVVS